ncbi:MAG: YggS family pyridoxal phosphate-dependent enzyme [Erythrobacter sp.]
MENSPAKLLENVHEEIVRACKAGRRSPDDVTLIAVSKTHAIERITPLIDAGQRVFGENRVGEAQEKWPALLEAHPDIELHAIGQLQSNKADDAVALFDYIHALDRPSLVKALAKAMDKADKRVPCFLQVNIGAEEQKGGCPVADLPALISNAQDADIPIAGLMCLPPAGIEPTPFFAHLAKIADDTGLTEAGAGLSMGMSSDYAIAVQLGASHIRVGTALFGARG